MTGQALLSIGEVCFETGLTVDVVRAWERRYGFPVPVRLPSGHRRYQREDLFRLRLMAEAMVRGHRAALVVRSDEATLQRILQPQSNERVDGLFEVLLRGDATEMRCRLIEDLSRLGWRAFMRKVIFPLLDRVGVAWASGALQAEHEVLVSRLLEELLGRLRRECQPAPGQVRVLLCVLPGERRRLDLLLAALAYTVHGARTHVLELGSPIAEIAMSARVLRVDHVGVTLSIQNTGEPVRRMLMDLKDRLPMGCHLLVGGRGAARTRRVEGVDRMDVLEVA